MVMVRRGFTLIELLIVIGIIGLLLQLLLPAIQSAREAARRTQCTNNVRQLTLGYQLHENSMGHYPTGGWGWRWSGLPNRGYGKDQPGGWIYNILPYISQSTVREIGTGLADDSPEQLQASLQLNTTPLAVLNCATRRPLLIYPAASANALVLLPPGTLDSEGKADLFHNDYAANAGNQNGNIGWILDNCYGPHNLEQAEAWEEWAAPKGEFPNNGISYYRSQVESRQITDGLSRTYCVGEKFVPQIYYETGISDGDDQSAYIGHDFDTLRWSGNEGETILVYHDNVNNANQTTHAAAFGSAHPSGAVMGFCDGSVTLVPFDIDEKVHFLQGGREDAGL